MSLQTVSNNEEKWKQIPIYILERFVYNLYIHVLIFWKWNPIIYFIEGIDLSQDIFSGFVFCKSVLIEHILEENAPWILKAGFSKLNLKSKFVLVAIPFWFSNVLMSLKGSNSFKKMFHLGAFYVMFISWTEICHQKKL